MKSFYVINNTIPQQENYRTKNNNPSMIGERNLNKDEPAKKQPVNFCLV
jgi:hypothetical protein